MQRITAITTGGRFMVLTTRQSYRILAAITAALLLSACQSANPIQAINLNQAQGSSENISSLTAAINSNPQNPETYNVRGTAYGLSLIHI